MGFIVTESCRNAENYLASLTFTKYSKESTFSSDVTSGPEGPATISVLFVAFFRKLLDSKE
jgi:hypothetical protein